VSTRLDDLVSLARSDDASPPFDASRSLARALKKKEARARRDRIVRRAIVAASGACFLGVLLFRGAGASSPTASAAANPAPEGARADLVSSAQGDGGFARD
jgi:hypothetical protein